MASVGLGSSPDADDASPRGIIRWLVSCDESGVHGARHYGFGTLWMNWQRRGDSAALIRGVREEHDQDDGQRPGHRV